MKKWSDVVIFTYVQRGSCFSRIPFSKRLSLTLQKAEQRQIKDYLNKADVRIQRTQQNIDDENRRLAEISDGGYARKQEECEQAASRAAAARNEYDQHEQGASRLQEDVKAVNREVESKRKVVDAKRKDVTQAEDRLRALAREDGQKQSGFPDRMPHLQKAIQQERSFTSRPIGPLGEHVTLLKPKWSSILESSFGTNLTGFIVTCKRDMTILSNIMSRVNW